MQSREAHESRLARRYLLQRVAGAAGVAAVGFVFSASLGWPQTKAQNQSSTRGPRIAYTHPAYILALNSVAAPRDFGPRAGLSFGSQDLTFFESHSVATQSLLAGRYDVIAGSTASNLAVISRGAPLKIFLSIHNSHNLVLAAREHVNSMDQLFDPKVRVGVDSPGGAGHQALMALLKVRGIRRSWKELPNVVTLESTVARTTALANGDIDVGVINSTQWEQLNQAMPGRFKQLAALHEEVPNYLSLSFAARVDYLENSAEAVTRLAEALLEANRTLMTRYPTFLQAVRRYIAGGGPEEPLVRRAWSLIRQFPIWDPNGDLEDAAVDTMIDLAQEASLVARPLRVAEVVDRRPLETALQRLGRVSREQLLG